VEVYGGGPDKPPIDNKFIIAEELIEVGGKKNGR
jgi:hypothetical protein